MNELSEYIYGLGGLNKLTDESRGEVQASGLNELSEYIYGLGGLSKFTDESRGKTEPPT